MADTVKKLQVIGKLQGEPGYSPTVDISEIDGGHQISITDANGTKTVDVMNGKDGAPGRDGVDGQPGKDGVDGKDGADGLPGEKGISPTVEVQDIEGGHRVTITDKDGDKTFDVMDGKDGSGGSGGASVQSDWSVNDESDPAHIKNRTHYEAPPAFDIVWDGVIGDKFAMDLSALGYESGLYLVKVDERVFTLEELCGATFYVSDGAKRELNAENYDTYAFPGVFYAGWMGVVYASDKLNAAIGLPDGTITNGVYFLSDTNEAWYTSRFVSKDVSKKLDTRYLPDGYPYESEPKFNIIWDGDMEGRTTLDMTSLGFEGFYFAKVSDDVLGTEDLIGAEYYFNESYGNNSEIYETSIDSTTYPGAHAINREVIIVYDQSQLNTVLGLPDGYLTNGTYFVASPTGQLYIARLTGKTEVHPIDGKYIDNVYSKAEMDNLLLNGGSSVPMPSTADNGKFLRVVNGSATWVNIENAEEATFGG